MGVTGWRTGFEGCVIWPLRVVLCLMTGCAIIVPLYKGKGERTEYSNYRVISLLSMVGKIDAWILVDRVHKVTEGLTDNEKGGFRAGRGCVDQIFTLKQIGEKTWEKKFRVCWFYGPGERYTIGSIGRY